MVPLNGSRTDWPGRWMLTGAAAPLIASADPSIATPEHLLLATATP